MMRKRTRRGDRAGRPYMRSRWLLPLVALLLALGGVFSTAAQEPNAAGLVIRHGDGTLVYSYVQFEEDSINGLDLLTRSELDVTVAPYGGLGGGVCKINGEGCSSDNCFCKSYTSPAFYWHYYILEDGDWVEYPLGPSSRDLSDGDVDGWSWTSGTSHLPDVDIEEIAAVSAVPTPTAPATTTAESTPEPESDTRAVVVEPGATPVQLISNEQSDDDDSSTYLVFVAMVAVVVVAGGFAVVRSRTRAS